MAGHGRLQATSIQQLEWFWTENPANASLDIVAALRFNVTTAIALLPAMMYVHLSTVFKPNIFSLLERVQHQTKLHLSR